jgi:hypothetical protein
MEKQHDENKCNGWTNCETWTVSLWLDNEEPSYRYWRKEAARQRREAGASSRVRSGLWTESEAARINLADELKEAVTEGAPLKDAGLYSDLLSAALSEVNWLEIADHWVCE